MSPTIRLEFLKAKGLELILSILASPESNSKLDSKGLSIINDYLLNEKDMFPSAPNIVSQQIEKTGVLPIIIGKLLNASITDFFFQDKAYLLLEYIKNHYKNELVQAEKLKINEFVTKLKEELKTNKDFHEALAEEVNNFTG